jgi:hypothetical protein
MSNAPECIISPSLFRSIRRGKPLKAIREEAIPILGLAHDESVALGPRPVSSWHFAPGIYSA